MNKLLLLLVVLAFVVFALRIKGVHRYPNGGVSSIMFKDSWM